MRTWKPLLVVLFTTLCLSFGLVNPPPANAQVIVKPCTSAGLDCIPVSSSNPFPVTGSFSTSGGFTALTTGTPISVTTGGVSGTLPTGTVVVATNVGATNGAYCALGASATTSSQYLSPGGGWFAFAVGASTQLTCITSTSTTTVNMTGGSGLPTGTGGGGGGGSGGAVTIASGGVASGAYASGAFASGSIASGAVASGAFASGSLASGAGTDGWNVTEGAKADSAWSSGSGSIVAILKTVATNTGSIIPGCQIKATTTCVPIGSVYSAAHTYNTVAASQTTQALTGGSGGATGDYLSHCTLMPTSTSPGELIIYDNSTAIYTVTLGSTSVSNLVPFTIPIGAISTSGAWKVTTGANETVTCVGAFT